MIESKFPFLLNFLTYLEKPPKNKTKMATELTCSVCGSVVGEAHKCIIMQKKLFACSARKATRMKMELDKPFLVSYV